MIKILLWIFYITIVWLVIKLLEMIKDLVLGFLSKLYELKK